MKRTIILYFLLLGIPILALAQAKLEASTQTQDSFVLQVNELCKQVDSIIQDINREYEKYKKDTIHYEILYKNKLVQTITSKKLKDEEKDTREKIEKINDSIDEIKQEIAWVDTLNGYYTNHQLDLLFDAIDWPALQVHKRLLGNDAPKAVNDLHIMHECADLLKRECNEKANRECLSLLDKVGNCDKKEELKTLLQMHSAITSETNGWSVKEHSLYELMDFRKYLHEEYGVNLEKDYPYLAEKSRKTVSFK